MHEAQKSWWKGSFPSWIVFGLFSVVSFMGTRYINHIETRWENMQLRLTTYVTVTQFEAYQRQHKEWADEVLRRMDNQLTDANRRLERMEERQERLLDAINNKKP